MREGWKEVEFGDVVEFPPKIRLKKNEMYPFIPMEDIEINVKYVRPKSKKIISGGGAKFAEGDTLFARITPSLENGKIAQAKGLNGKVGFGSTEYFVFRGKKNITDTDFVYYLSKTQWFIQNAVNSMVGASGRQRADAKFVKNTKIQLPPLPTQRKIAQILSAYDDLIENNLRRIALLEEQAQLTYEEWFVRMRFPGFEEVEIVEGLPIGWRKEALGKLVKLIQKAISAKDVNPNTPYIGLVHIPRKSITLSTWEYAEKVNSNKITFKINDILFGKIRPYFHKVGVALIDGIASTDTIILRPLNIKYHGLILQTVFSENFVNTATKSSNGTKMPRANWKVLKEYSVIIPTEKVLIKYQGISESIIKSIKNLTNQNRLLQEARDILLPRLMMGVVDVEEVVGQVVKECGEGLKIKI